MLELWEGKPAPLPQNLRDGTQVSAFSYRRSYITSNSMKGKDHPRTDHEGPKGGVEV